MSKKMYYNNCKHVLLITDAITGEISCNKCGTVLNEKPIDFESERIIQGIEQSTTRTGNKIALKMADMGLSTLIESKDRDSSGKILSDYNKRSFYRLRIWDRNSRYATTKQSFVNAFLFLDGIRSKLGLPDHVVEKTAYLFRKMEQKKLLLGRSNKVILCGSVYAACRLTNTPRTIRDIADAGGIKKKIIQRTYRMIIRNLEVSSKSYRPTEFIERIANEVNISEKSKRQARKILERGQKEGLTQGKHPMAMAAASVYMAAQKNGEKISQMSISKASIISTVSIRNRVKDLEKIQ